MISANFDVIFLFLANLQPTGRPIPDQKLTFSLTITIYLRKTENRTKISNTALILLL